MDPPVSESTGPVWHRTGVGPWQHFPFGKVTNPNDLPNISFSPVLLACYLFGMWGKWRLKARKILRSRIYGLKPHYSFKMTTIATNNSDVHNSSYYFPSTHHAEEHGPSTLWRDNLQSAQQLWEVPIIAFLPARKLRLRGRGLLKVTPQTSCKVGVFIAALSTAVSFPPLSVE